MLGTSIYYAVKPLLPWRLRMMVRRIQAKAVRRAHQSTWPIDPRAGATPPGWPGWPEGKQFALVLTHDVEGTKGLGRIEQLMRLDASHGFRSSFFLVPEGEYRVPQTIRDTLTTAGFDIGVHGLQHDGKLYDSHEGFSAKATQIRRYLKEWGAVGFRSPLMQHRLPWLHELELEFDASTFDTDPFEPQPDGVQTIFPFWVPQPSGPGGYVELPYTLPQDSTVFLVLQEKTIDIWKRKLDWVVQHGGMALMNSHPDYMCFEGSPLPDEFPVALYEEFLSYVNQRYEGRFWVATPREVTQHYCDSLPETKRNSRKRVCMVTHSSYENDNRVRRYAEALASRGDLVNVIAVAGGNVPLGTETISGVTVQRVQRRSYDDQSVFSHAWRLLRFLLVSSRKLTRLHQQVRFDVVHVHNMPDFLVFAAWYPKLTGSGLILDLHDLVPELFESKFNAGGRGAVRLLRAIEKASAAFADHVIISNHLWHKTVVGRSVPADKCSVFINHVDPAIFYRRPRTRKDDRVVVVFPGSFQWHQGLDIAIRAFARVKERIPGAEFHIYGGGSLQPTLAGLAADLDLNGSVQFRGSVPLHEIPNVIAQADLGVVPKRSDSFGNEAYSTKIMEFMSQGVPVVASRTKIDTYYFKDSEVCFFPSGDSEEMASAMLNVIADTLLRRNMIENSFAHVSQNSWHTRKTDYLRLVDSL